MTDPNRVLKVVTGRVSLDGVSTVTCESLPPVRVAIVEQNGDFHGIPLAQTVPSEEWEGETVTRQVDPTRVRLKVRGVATLELAVERSQQWADARVCEILSESFAGLEVQ